MSKEKAKKVNEIKHTEIIEEYLDLIRCTYPYCNCGKCISKKYSHHAPNYQYEKNLKSSYKKEFIWKNPSAQVLNSDSRKPIIKNLGLDDCFKEHLKDSLVSVMRNDYSINLKLKENYVLNKLKEGKLNPLKNNVSMNLRSNFNIAIGNNIDLKNNKIENNQINFKISKSPESGKNDSNSQAEIFKKITNYKIYNKDSGRIKKLEILNHSKKKIESMINENSKDVTSHLRNKSLNIKINNNFDKINITNEHDLTTLNSLNNIDTNNINNTLNPPFLGDSSYRIMYPDWQTSKVVKEKIQTSVFESVPFNGKSNYKENYLEHEKRYYVERTNPILKFDNLENTGKIDNETTSKQTYKPIDYKQYSELNNGGVRMSKRPSSIVTAPYSKDSFLSSYEKAFMYNNLKPKIETINNVNKSVIY